MSAVAEAEPAEIRKVPMFSHRRGVVSFRRSRSSSTTEFPLLLGGRSGDLLGRRRIFIAGILLFSLASLLGGFATDQAWLLASLPPAV